MQQLELVCCAHSHLSPGYIALAPNVHCESLKEFMLCI